MDCRIVVPPVTQSSGTDRVAGASNAEGPARYAATSRSKFDPLAALIGIAAGIGFITIGLLGVFLAAQVAVP